jgi:hypothetical protein
MGYGLDERGLILGRGKGFVATPQRLDRKERKKERKKDVYIKPTDGNNLK